MADEPDGTLPERFVHGDREAFELLFRRFEHDVFRWGLRLVRDPATAEDVVVEAIMRPHPYLRAYMAGIVVPTVFLLAMPARPLSRALVFPMAIVPNLWGAWNMLHLKLRSRVPVSIGAFGAVLPLLLFPGGIMPARALDVFTIQWRFALPIIPIGMAVYYLAWKTRWGS
jgi:hypothetical protein